MKQTRKLLAVLLIFSMLIPNLGVASAAPSKMTAADLAAASAKVATQIQTAISSAPASGGVRQDVVMPESITVGSYSMGVEDYTLMAAQAICAINGGNSSTIAIACKDVSLTGDFAKGVNIDTVDKDMILDLATRTMKYGVTLGKLPTSFIRPVSDTTYEGRICIYSIAYIFAQTLSTYSSNASLPVSVTFTPTSFTTTETSTPTVSESDSSSGATTAPDLNEPENPQDTLTPGNIELAETVERAQKHMTFCDNNAQGPNDMTTSLGVPGRYAHGYCHFSAMSTGHVWETIYCGTKWYTADLVSNYNYLGYKTNTTGTFYSYYAQLPF